MGMHLQRKQKRIAIAAVAIAAIVTVSLVIVLTLPSAPPEPNRASSYAKKVIFSEVQVSGVTEEEFVELYTWDAPGSNLAGWKMMQGGRSVTLPAITSLGNLSYILLRFGPGANDTDASDKNAMIFFNLGMPFLDSQGALKLVDTLGLIVDYYNYGNVAPVDSVGWPAGDTGIVASAAPVESMQIWGPDVDASTNWYINTSTPNHANGIEFTEPFSATPIVVYNGINIALPTTNGSDYEFLGKIVVKGRPAGWTTKAKIEEMAKFTVDFYTKKGFPTPHLGPDGKLDIWIAAGNTTESTGATDRDGSIWVDVGTTGGMAGNVSLKNTVEHEIMHAIQARVGGDGMHDHWADDANRPFTEGMAVWGGVSSTMANYNLTWTQAMAYLKQAGDHNWFDNFRDLNNTAIPWGGSYDDYMNMGMFFKFLNETYGGAGKIVQILNGIKNYWNKSQGVDVNARDAIAAAVGKSFDQIWRAYHEWLVNGSATAKNKFPPLTPHSSPSPPTSPTSPPVIDGPKTVQPYGADIEFINCSGKTQKFTINFGNLNTSDSWRITVIYTKPDGTKVTKWFSIQGSVAPIPVDPSQWANITVVKTRIGSSGNGSISMILSPTPASTFPGEHRDIPRHSNCSAATPEVTISPLYDHGPMDEVWYSLWLGAGDILTCSVFNNTGNPNYITFEILTLDPAVPPATPSLVDPLLEPKTLVLPCLEPSLYSIHIMWNVAEFGLLPPGQPVEVEVNLSIAHP